MSDERPHEPTAGLSIEEDLQLASLLSKWSGGKISMRVFTELARIIPQPIVEVVILRDNEGVLETLLIPRPGDDIVWPEMYHTPGAAIREADFHREDKDPINGAFERIQHGELKNEFTAVPSHVGKICRMGARGPEIAEIYVAQLVGEHSNKDHLWYPVDQLADNPKFIQHQLPQVMIAAEAYRHL